MALMKCMMCRRVRRRGKKNAYFNGLFFCSSVCKDQYKSIINQPVKTKEELHIQRLNAKDKDKCCWCYNNLPGKSFKHNSLYFCCKYCYTMGKQFYRSIQTKAEG